MKTSEAKAKAERYAEMAAMNLADADYAHSDRLIRIEACHHATALASIAQVYATIYAAELGTKG